MNSLFWEHYKLGDIEWFSIDSCYGIQIANFPWLTPLFSLKVRQSEQMFYIYIPCSMGYHVISKHPLTPTLFISFPQSQYIYFFGLLFLSDYVFFCTLKENTYFGILISHDKESLNYFHGNMFLRCSLQCLLVIFITKWKSFNNLAHLRIFPILFAIFFLAPTLPQELSETNEIKINIKKHTTYTQENYVARK